MARFTKSNRHAVEQMNRTGTRKHSDPHTGNVYFRRIGFDFAMI